MRWKEYRYDWSSVIFKWRSFLAVCCFIEFGLLSDVKVISSSQCHPFIIR